MRSVQVDEKTGELVCWNCGSSNFLAKRTFRSKVTFGPFALLTHKKLKCQACGEYNQTGTAFEAPPVTVRDLLNSDDKGAVLRDAGKELLRGRGFKGR